MENHYSPSRRSRTVASVDHFLLGVGVVAALDNTSTHERWVKIPQCSEYAGNSRKLSVPQATQALSREDSLAVPQVPQVRQITSPRFGTTESIRQTVSVTTTFNAEHDGGPISPADSDKRFVFEYVPHTSSPSRMERMHESAGNGRSTLPLITIGLPTPPGSESYISEHPSPKAGSSPSLRSAHSVVRTSPGRKRRGDVSPQGVGHARTSTPSPCSCCNRSRFDTPIPESESRSPLCAHLDQIDAGFRGTPLQPLGEQRTICQTRIVANCLNDFTNQPATGKCGTYLDPFYSPHHVPRVPSPLRENFISWPKLADQSLSVPNPSASTASPSNSSEEIYHARSMSQSQMFICRLKGCFEQNGSFFIAAENRNQHELSEHGLDYERVAKDCLAPQILDLKDQRQSQDCSNQALDRFRPRQPSLAPSNTNLDESLLEEDCNTTRSGTQIKVPAFSVNPHSVEPISMDSATKSEPQSTALSKSENHQEAIQQFPQNTQNDKIHGSASPDPSSRSSQTSPSSLSTPSSDGVMIKPLAKERMDEMIDDVMEEFEDMFYYFLGFDTREDLDISSPSESEYEGSDLEDESDLPNSITTPCSSASGLSSSTQSSILGSKARCNTTAGESSTSRGTPKVMDSRAQSSKPSYALGKRKRRDSKKPNDDEDDGNSGKGKRQKGSEPEKKGVKFACPFYQRQQSSNQSRARLHASCMFPGFPTVARMKEHLYRRHLQKPHCVRCCEEFSTQEKLDEHHLALVRCEELLDKPVVQGITSQQEKDLRSRRAKEGVNTEEEKWVDVYFILFPQDAEAPSPYCTNSQEIVQHPGVSPDSARFRAFERYSRREFPRRVRAELQEAAVREEALMQERLTEVMVEAARRAAETLWAAFREDPDSCTRDPPSSQATESPTTQNSEPQHAQIVPTRQIEFFSPPPLQAPSVPDARTAIVEAGSRSNQMNRPVTDGSQSDSAYGTLLNGSDDTYTARSQTNEPSNYVHAGATPFHTNYAAAGPTLSQFSSAANPNITPAHFAPIDISQQPNWTYLLDERMGSGFPSDDWSLFQGHTMSTEAYSENIPLPHIPNPQMGNNGNERDN